MDLDEEVLAAQCADQATGSALGGGTLPPRDTPGDDSARGAAREADQPATVLGEFEQPVEIDPWRLRITLL